MKFGSTLVGAVVALLSLFAVTVYLDVGEANAQPIQGKSRSVRMAAPAGGDGSLEFIHLDSVQLAAVDTNSRASRPGAQPQLEVLLTIVTPFDDCPMTWAEAEAVPNNPGVDDNDPTTDNDYDTLPGGFPDGSPTPSDAYVYCVMMRNAGSVDAYNVTLNLTNGVGIDDTVCATSYANCGLPAGEEWGGYFIDEPTSIPSSFVATIDGQFGGGYVAPGSGSQDQAGVRLFGPANLEVLLTASTSIAGCPATFDDAAAVQNNPGVAPNHDVVPASLNDTVYYCVNAKNTGEGPAWRVELAGSFLPSINVDWTTFPLQSGPCGFGGCAPTCCQWDGGDEFAYHFEHSVAAMPEVRTATITGYSFYPLDSDAAPGSGSSDSAGVAQPELGIELTAVVPSDSCPETYAEAQAMSSNTLDLVVGATVKFCINGANSGQLPAYMAFLGTSFSGSTNYGGLYPAWDPGYEYTDSYLFTATSPAAALVHNVWVQADHYPYTPDSGLSLIYESDYISILLADVPLGSVTCTFSFDSRFVNLHGGVVSVTLSDGTTVALSSASYGPDITQALNDAGIPASYDGFSNSDIQQIVIQADLASVDFGDGSTAVPTNCAPTPG